MANKSNYKIVQAYKKALSKFMQTNFISIYRKHGMKMRTKGFFKFREEIGKPVPKPLQNLILSKVCESPYGNGFELMKLCDMKMDKAVTYIHENLDVIKQIEKLNKIDPTGDKYYEMYGFYRNVATHNKEVTDQLLLDIREVIKGIVKDNKEFFETMEFFDPLNIDAFPDMLMTHAFGDRIYRGLISEFRVDDGFHYSLFVGWATKLQSDLEYIKAMAESNGAMVKFVENEKFMQTIEKWQVEDIVRGEAYNIMFRSILGYAIDFIYSNDKSVRCELKTALNSTRSIDIDQKIKVITEHSYDINGLHYEKKFSLNGRGKSPSQELARFIWKRAYTLKELNQFID